MKAYDDRRLSSTAQFGGMAPTRATKNYIEDTFDPFNSRQPGELEIDFRIPCQQLIKGKNKNEKFEIFMLKRIILSTCQI